MSNKIDILTEQTNRLYKYQKLQKNQVTFISNRIPDTFKSSYDNQNSNNNKSRNFDNNNREVYNKYDLTSHDIKKWSSNSNNLKTNKKQFS